MLKNPHFGKQNVLLKSELFQNIYSIRLNECGKIDLYKLSN